ncbi:unnamed protein product [Rotaria sordida]|uniref:ADP-ribosylhydrolase ARH3 n=1 Tax=Rotaria sordida TaxID=392033 RepID=A0A814KEP0_9BILA|nr:unnamed protein product [Rotaria sordida]
MAKQSERHPSCQFRTDKSWLVLQYNSNGKIMIPHELEKYMIDPPENIDSTILDRIHGSMIGMALGDALGAYVEFRSHQYLLKNPVTDLQAGGTWGLNKGEFTDDTSMALCLANSLVARCNYVPYDQMVRYKWWYRKGYMSSIGYCFDMGSATKQALTKFESRQKAFAEKHDIPLNQLDYLSDPTLLNKFDVYCSEEGVAGNGALMRLAPVPLFFYRYPVKAIEFSGHSGRITHGDQKAYDACRYYGALIVAALRGEKKRQLLDNNFYSKHERWFDNKPLHPDILAIAKGSYKKDGYDEGIRGNGYIVNALEAALWAFWSDKEDFEKGVLAAVNLGDDTDTTAAIYGQLAGAYYGYKNLPKHWVEQVYAKTFISSLSKWIAYEGPKWSSEEPTTSAIPSVIVESSFDDGNQSSVEQTTSSSAQSSVEQTTSSSAQSQVRRNRKDEPNWSTEKLNAESDSSLKFKQLDNINVDCRPRRSFLLDLDFSMKINSPRRSVSSHTLISPRDDPTSSSEQLYNHETYKSCQDVCRWIQSFGKEYTKKLAEYGIQSSAHRQFIMNRIEQLKKECPVHFAVKKK